MSGKDGNETQLTNSAQCFGFDCWRFGCIIIIIAIMMILLLCCCRYFHRGIFPIHRRKWSSNNRNEKCFIKTDTYKYEGIENCPTRQNTNFRNNLYCLPKLSNTCTNKYKSNFHGSYLKHERGREPREGSHTNCLKKREGNIENSSNSENYIDPYLTLSNWSCLSKITKDLKSSLSRLKSPSATKSAPAVLNYIRLNKEEEEIVKRCVNNQGKPDISFSDTDIRLFMKSPPPVKICNQQQEVNRKQERFEKNKILPYFNNDKGQQSSIHDFQLGTIDCGRESLETCNRIVYDSSDSEMNYAISLTLLPTMSDYTKCSLNSNINLRLHITKLSGRSTSSTFLRNDKSHFEKTKNLLLSDTRNKAKSYITLPNTKIRGLRKVKSANYYRIYGIYNFNKILRSSASNTHMKNSSFQIKSEILQHKDKQNSKHQYKDLTHSEKIQLVPQEDFKMFDITTQVTKSFQSDFKASFHISPQTGSPENNESYLKMQECSPLVCQEYETNNNNMTYKYAESSHGSEMSESFDELGMLISQYLKEQMKPCQRNYCSIRRRLKHRVWHDQKQCCMRSKYHHKYSYDQRPSCSSGNICKDTYDELKLMHASPLERGFLYKSIYERRKQFLSQPCVPPFILPLDS